MPAVPPVRTALGENSRARKQKSSCTNGGPLSSPIPFSNKLSQATPCSYPAPSVYSTLLTRTSTMIWSLSSVIYSTPWEPSKCVLSAFPFIQHLWQLKEGCSSQKSLISPLVGALHTYLPIQVLQPHLTALESLSQPDPPSVVLLHDPLLLLCSGQGDFTLKQIYLVMCKLFAIVTFSH